MRTSKDRRLRGFPPVARGAKVFLRFQRDERKLGPHPKCPRDEGFAFSRSDAVLKYNTLFRRSAQQPNAMPQALLCPIAQRHAKLHADRRSGCAAMVAKNSVWLKRAVILALSVAVAGCASKQPRHTSHAPAPSRPAAADTEAIWHLRSGLNVAALNCRGRGRAHVAPAYNRMLGRHRQILSSAYAFELNRHGQRALDGHLTQIYNRFANQRSLDRFCSTASTIVGEVNAMASAELSHSAPRFLRDLERSLK